MPYGKPLLKSVNDFRNSMISLLDDGLNGKMMDALKEVTCVDEIFIDANMDLQWPHMMSLMPPSPTCSALNPYKVVLHLVVIWIPYRVGLCLEAPCTQLTRCRTHRVGS